MVPGVEGGVTKHYPGGETMPIFNASTAYQHEGVPLVIFAGQGIRHRFQPRLGRRRGRGCSA